MKIDPAVIDKIRKILALAENNSSLEEAETAALFVQRLLLQHGLSLAEVRDDGNGGKTVEEARPEQVEYRHVPWWVKSLASIISRNFRCEAIIRTHPGGNRSLFFIGLAQDVEVASLTYNRIKTAYNASLRRFIQENRVMDTAEKNDYTEGFLSGLRRKFTEQVEEYALVLAQDPLVREHIQSMGLRKGRKSAITRTFSRRAWETGHKDGRAAGDRPKPLT